MGMSDPKVVPIRAATLKPSRRLRRMALALHGPGFLGSIADMTRDAVAVEALAAALDRALNAALSKDGRLDLRVAAEHLLGEMKRNQL